MLTMTIDEGHRRPLPFDLKTKTTGFRSCKLIHQNVQFEESEFYKLIDRKTRANFKLAYDHLLTLNQHDQIIVRSEKTFKTYLHHIVDQAPHVFVKYGGLTDLVPLIYELAFRGVIVNAQDKHGNTCLHAALIKPHAQSLCVHLLRIGADPAIPNKNNLRVVHTYSNHRFELVKGESNVMCGLWYAIQQENKPLTRKLLQSWCRVNVEKEDKLLDVAQVSMVKLLEDSQATNEMVCAAFSCNLQRLERLIKHRTNRDLKDAAYQPPKPLMVILGELGHWSVPVVNKLIREGFDDGSQYKDEVIEYSTRFEGSDFFKFLENGSRESLLRASKLILKKQVEVTLLSNHPKRMKFTYLHYAVSRYLEIANEREEDGRILIRMFYRLAVAGIDVNARNELGETALVIAASHKLGSRLILHLIRIGSDSTIGNLENKCVCMECVFVKGAIDLKAKCKWQYMPGVWAALKRNDVTATKRWLETLCRTRLTKGDRTITEIAVSLGHLEIAQLFRDYDSRNEFAVAVFASDKKAMYELLVMGNGKMKVNLCDKYYNAAPIESVQQEYIPKPIVVYAMELSTPAVLRYLIAQGSELHAAYNHVYPCGPIATWAFMNHVNNNNTLVVAQLANVNLCDENGCTMLHRIVVKQREQKRIGIVKALLERGIQIPARNMHGYTARDLIAQYPAEESLEIRQLIDDYVLEMVNSNIVSRLEKLVFQSYDHIIDIKGTRRMKSAMELALIKQLRRMSQFLNKIPVYENLVSELISATRNGDLKIVAKEIDNKTAFIRDTKNRTLLHNAILFNHVEVAQFLIENYPSLIDMQDSVGRTALHYCSMLENKFPIWNFLVNGAANENVLDYNYLSVRDYIREMDRPTKVYLKPAGKRFKNFQPSKEMLVFERNQILLGQDKLDESRQLGALDSPTLYNYSELCAQISQGEMNYTEEDDITE